MAKFTTDSKFLSHNDISDVEDTIVTIKSYDRETMGQGTQQVEKWVIYFRELKKGLGLNKTNGKILCNILRSDDMDQWIGHKIALYVKDDVEYQGEIVSAIRIRNKLPGQAAAPSAPPRHQDVPTDQSSGPLTVKEIIYRLDHAESVGQIASIMNEAMGIKDLSVENLKSLMVLKDQRIDVITAKA